ncbi:MAG: hypothetical protein AB7G76_03590 [Steroidobacteraceae bacterium]
MKRRDFFAVSIGTTLAARQGFAFAQSPPCPPPMLESDGGGQAQNPCTDSAEGAAVERNTVKLVGTNSEASVKPAGISAADWQYSLFASWSGGAFVPGWGTHGAYVCANTGGHGAPENYDAVLFDFADYTWKFLANTQGVAANSSPRSGGSTTGSPWYEVSGTQVPSPSHVYKHQIGVGASLYQTARHAVCTESLTADRTVRLALNANRTCTYMRFGTNSTYSAFPGFNSFGGFDSAEAMYDPVRNRLWHFTTMTHYVSTMPWMNLSTGTWSGTAVGNFTAEGNSRAALIHDQDAGYVWVGKSTGQLYRVNLASSQLRYEELSSTGTANIGMSGPGEGTRWHKYPVADGGDGCFYTYIDNGSRQLKKFDPVSRVFSNVTVSIGPAIPRIGSAIYPNQSTHFTRFCYVPARKCFAWVPGNGQQIALLRP